MSETKKQELEVFKIDKNNFDDIKANIQLVKYGVRDIKFLNITKDNIVKKLLFTTGFITPINLQICSNEKFNPKEPKIKIKMKYDNTNDIHKKINDQIKFLTSQFHNTENFVIVKQYDESEIIGFNRKLKDGVFNKLYVLKDGKRVNIKNLSNGLLYKILNKHECDILFSYKLIKMNNPKTTISADIHSITVKYSDDLDFLKEFSTGKVEKPKETEQTQVEKVKSFTTNQIIKESNNKILDMLFENK